MTKTVSVAAIDPGTKRLGLSVRRWKRLTFSKHGQKHVRVKLIGPGREMHHSTVSGDDPVDTAMNVVNVLDAYDDLDLVLIEGFAYSRGWRMSDIAQTVGAVRLWCRERNIECVMIPIGTLKKSVGVPGNSKRTFYVAALRRMFSGGRYSDDERVALALLRFFAKDVWESMYNDMVEED